MKCFDPTLCYTTERKKYYRSFSVAIKSPLFRGLKPSHVFNCDKCIYCRARRSTELAARCVLHASLYDQNCFLTLTYDESKPGYHNNLNYSDIQKLKKRIRSHVWRHHQKRVDLFNVHEYGKNGKKHWHLILFNHDFSEDKEIHTMRNNIPLYISKTLDSLWPHGFSTIGSVTEASAMYQAQYMDKDFRNGNVTNSKKSKSKHSGLAGPYFKTHYKQLLRLGYIPFSGRKLPLPRYFEKIAHKHYCHFYEKSAFFDNKQRKALHRPFKLGQENQEIADLYLQYKAIKQTKVNELEEQFNEVISQYLTDKADPDFVRSGLNKIYDLNKRQLEERF